MVDACGLCVCFVLCVQYCVVVYFSVFSLLAAGVLIKWLIVSGFDVR